MIAEHTCALLENTTDSSRFLRCWGALLFFFFKSVLVLRQSQVAIIGENWVLLRAVFSPLDWLSSQVGLGLGDYIGEASVGASPSEVLMLLTGIPG